MTRLGLFILCAIGLFACASTPVPEKTSPYEKEKAALEAATEVGTSSALDRFLADYPTSSWVATAIYRRDRAALEEAKRIGTREAFEEFLHRYPQSDWADLARYFMQYGVTPNQKKANQSPEPMPLERPGST